MRLDDIQKSVKLDQPYTDLITTIKNGFANIHNNLLESIRSYWGVRDQLKVTKNTALMDDCIVIPPNLCKTVMYTYSAHQGINNMCTRDNQIINWPGMSNEICNIQYTCHICKNTEPSQAKEPLTLTSSPDGPFQKIRADYSALDGHSYLSIVDRFSGPISIYHFPPHNSTSKKLIDTF